MLERLEVAATFAGEPRELYDDGNIKVEATRKRALVLPLFPELTELDYRQTVDAINNAELGSFAHRLGELHARLLTTLETRGA